jgi:hypothetical protein
MREYKPTQHDLEGFDSMPRCISRNPDVSISARLLFLYINSFAGATKGCLVSNARLAAYLGINPRQVQRLLSELKSKGLISEHPSNSPTGRRLVVLVKAEKTKNTRKISTHDTNVMPPTTCMSSPHDIQVTQDIDRDIERRVPPISPKLEDGGFALFKEVWAVSSRTGEQKMAFMQFKKALKRGCSSKAIKEGLAKQKAFDDAQKCPISKRKSISIFIRDDLFLKAPCESSYQSNQRVEEVEQRWLQDKARLNAIPPDLKAAMLGLVQKAN